MATINIINKSTIIGTNTRQRIDSEYYQAHYVKNDEALRKGSYFKIGTRYYVTDGEHGSVKYYPSGIRYLTAENINGGFVDISNVRYVDERVHENNARASVNPGDVLISIKATLGQVALAKECLPPCNMNRDVAIIKPLSAQHYRAESSYLTVFLMSKHGYIQAQRGASGAVQQMITLERLRQFVVPAFSKKFYSSIHSLLMSAYERRDESINLYAETEGYLRSILGISDLATSASKISVRGWAESFLRSGRIDAEYYQEKYDYIENALQTPYTVKDLCKIHESPFRLLTGDYKYIELSNIGPYGNITGCTVAPFDKLPSRARRLIRRGQIIVSSIEGSLGSCALVNDEYDGALCSTGFYVMDAPGINPETLLILFKSAPIQALLKKRCSGTILAAISKNALEAMPIPLVDDAAQAHIAADVQRSFTLRRQSECLLETAKRAVELAIEEGEVTAMGWLGGQEHALTTLPLT